MTMTEEQMIKAKQALRDHAFMQIKKRAMLHIYRADQKRAERWQLPFRMVHKHEYPPEEIQPNEYYPLPCNLYRDANGEPYPIPGVMPITETEARYFFTRLLYWNADKLRTYAPSDWTGSPTTAEEAERLQSAYFDRIQDFLEHPDRYDQEPHRMPLDARDRYFLVPTI